MRVDVRPHGVVSRRTLGATPANLLLQADSHLTEDYILSDFISADSNQAGSSIATFVNPANQQSEALVIEDGELFYVCREPLSDTGWNYFGIGAGFPYIAPLNSQGGWAFADDGSVWQNIAGRWSSPVSGRVPTAVATGTDGTIWGTIDGNIQVFNTTSTTWGDPPVSGNLDAPVDSLPSGSLNDLWLIQSGEIPQAWRYNGTGWTPIVAFLGPGAAELMSVFVGFDGSVFSLANDGALYMYFSPELQVPWIPVNVPLDFVAVAVAGENQIWAIADGNLLSMKITSKFPNLDASYTTLSGPFQLSGGPYTPSLMLGTDQTLWLTDTYGTVWKYLPLSSVQWQRQMMPPAVSGMTKGWNIQDVVAIADAEGDIHAYFTANTAGVWTTSLSNGDWTPPKALSFSSSVTCGALGVALDPPSGSVIVYSSTSDGMLMVAAAPGGPSQGAVFGSPGDLDALAPTCVGYYPGQISGGWAIFSTTNQFLNINVLPIASSTKFGQWTSWPSYALSDLVRLANPASGLVLGIDPSGNLWEALLDSQINVIGWYPLSGGNGSPLTAVSTVASTMNSLDVGLMNVFAIDPTGNLWLMRQTSPGPNWTSWHPLGDPCTEIAGGPGAAAVQEMYFTGVSSTSAGVPCLNQIAQNPVSLNWSAQPIGKPKQALDTPMSVSSYVTQVSVFTVSPSSNGTTVNTIAPSIPVTITTVEPVTVVVEGQTYAVPANQPQTFTSDGLGRVTLTTIATSLHTANLTISAPNATSISVYPPTLAHAALQNAASDSTGDAIANSQTTTSTIPLQTAPLVQANKSNAGDVANAVSGVFSVQNNSTNPITPNTTGPDQPMNEVTSAYHVARAFSAAKLVSHHPLRGPHDDPENLTLLGGFWDDLLKFAEDVFHAIRTGIIKIESIATDVAQGIVQISMSLANGVAQAVTYAVKTIDDVANAIQSAFQWLAAKVEAVINWLKELFSWQDIVNTGAVMAHIVSEFLSAASSYLAPSGPGPSSLQTLIDSQFSQLTDKINSSLESLAGNPNLTSMSQMVPSQYSSMQAPSTVSTGNANTQSQGNFAHRHTQSFVENGGNLSLQSGGSSALSAVTAVGSNAQTQHGATFQSFGTNLTSTFSQPTSLADAAIKELITIIQDVADAVLDVAQDLADAFLAIAGDALSGFQTILETTLNIPLVSWIFQELTGEPLTLLNLMSLLFALPATLIYKLLNNGTAPFAGQIQEYMDWTCSFPSIDGSASAERLGAGLPTSGFMGIGMFFTFFFTAVFDCASDALCMGPTPSVGLGNLYSIVLIFLTAGGMVMGGPWIVFSKDPSTWTAADIAYLTIFITGGLFWLLNIAYFVLFGGLGLAAKLSNPVGQTITGICGAFLFLEGLVFLDISLAVDPAEYNSYYYVAELLGPWSSIQKIFFPLAANNPDSAFIVIFFLVDMIADIGSGLMNMGEDGWLTSSTAPD